MFTGLKVKFKHKSGLKHLQRELKNFPAPIERKPGISAVGIIADLEKFKREERFYELVESLGLKPNAIKIIGYREFGPPAKFGRPVVTLVDTQGAYPGIGAEERGQAEAIARNLLVMAGLPVPIVTTIIGEGGSGGALGIAVADRILMLENAIYSVISPEGCAAILWRSRDKAEEAAEALKVTADDLAGFEIVDEVIAEPGGGAHLDPKASAQAVGEAIERHLDELAEFSSDELITRRREKYEAMGRWEDTAGV